MYISDLSAREQTQLTEEMPDLVISRDGEAGRQAHQVLRENLLSIYIQDILTMKVICCASDLPFLVMGRLRTEGIITSSEEVEGIYICENAARAKVFLRPDASGLTAGRVSAREPSPEAGSSTETAARAQGEGRDSFVETTGSCCTGNHLLNDIFVTEKDLQPVKPFAWKREWIFDMADRFADGTPLHNETVSTHSCFLSCDGMIVYECEDIGRHNALDKAVGYALLNDVDLSRCVIYTSGRVPTDMTLKAIRAGIPVLASKARPTLEAVSLARQYGLTLIGNARRDSFRVYTGYEMSGL